jgi:hydrogenase maturation protein HypF
LQAGGWRLEPVQHHHAHIAACLADNGLKKQKVIAVAFDGTGLGDDRTIWGAEFLLCDYRDYRRVGHLKEVPLLGGERAILEPWRLAAAWLYLGAKNNFWRLKVDFLKKWERQKWRVLEKMYLAGYNSPLASSMGRLFDAAASIILAKNKARFEAELALGLEKKAIRYQRSAMSWKFNTIRGRDGFVLDPAPVFKGIIEGLRQRETKEKLAFNFHLSLAEMISKVCLVLRKKYRLNQVVLSGGVFQNKLLLRLSLDLLYKHGFAVAAAKNVSANDSGISLGQAAIANFRN